MSKPSELPSIYRFLSMMYNCNDTVRHTLFSYTFWWKYFTSLMETTWCYIHICYSDILIKTTNEQFYMIWCWVLPVWRSSDFWGVGQDLMVGSSLLSFFSSHQFSVGHASAIVFHFAFYLSLPHASFFFICKAFLLKIVSLGIMLLAILALCVSTSIPMFDQFKCSCKQQYNLL